MNALAVTKKPSKPQGRRADMRPSSSPRQMNTAEEIASSIMSRAEIDIKKHLRSECDCLNHTHCWKAIGDIYRRAEKELREDLTTEGGGLMSYPGACPKCGGDTGQDRIDLLVRENKKFVKALKDSHRILTNVFYEDSEKFLSGVYDDPGDDEQDQVEADVLRSELELLIRSIGEDV